MTRHNRTPEQRAELQAKKAFLLALTPIEWVKMQALDTQIRLVGCTLAELQARYTIVQYDEAHPDRFTGDGKQALKELYGEV